MPDPFTLIGFIFILGALIFIHESGHYFMAKALGIRVEVFSLGFGPKLLRFTKGGTEYCISALPVGGYVKMMGENPDESLRGSPEEFQSRGRLERFGVLVMGALLNIVLAVVLMAGLFMHGVPEPLYLVSPPVVGSLDPNGAAIEAGVQLQDELVAINGELVPTWRDMHVLIALNPGRTLNLRIRRQGQVLDIPVTVRTTERDRIGMIGIGPSYRIEIAKVDSGGAADRAGIRPGDTLMAAGGIDLMGQAGYEALVAQLAASAGKPLALRVQRGAETIDLDVVPTERKDDAGVKGDLEATLSLPMGLRKHGPVEAMGESVKHNWESAGVLFLTLKKLVAGQISPRTLSGPIEIYRLTGESLRGGWIAYVNLMALISLQLGIINLLPIPVLDGGHIFILLVEGIIRRDLSMKIKERVLQFGFILLLLIMGGVIYMDLYKYINFGG